MQSESRPRRCHLVSGLVRIVKMCEGKKKEEEEEEELERDIAVIINYVNEEQ